MERLTIAFCLCLCAGMRPAWSDDLESDGAIAAANNREMAMEQRVAALESLGPWVKAGAGETEYRAYRVGLRSNQKHVDALIAILDSSYDSPEAEKEDRRLRAAAIQNLGGIFDSFRKEDVFDDREILDKVIAAYLRALGDPDPDIQRSAAYHLGTLPGRPTAEQLKAFILKGLNPTSTAPGARESVAYALNNIPIKNPDAEIRSALLNALDPAKEPSDFVRSRVALAIGESRLDDPELIRALRESADPRTQKEPVALTRSAAARALGSMGKPDAKTFALWAYILDTASEHESFHDAIDALGCSDDPQGCYLLRRQQARLEGIKASNPNSYSWSTETRLTQVTRNLEKLKESLKKTTPDGAEAPRP